MSWLRLYTDLIDDRKQAMMSDKTFRIFILLLCFAKELNQNGYISHSISDISWRIRIKETHLKKALEDLYTLGILCNEEHAIYFKNWDKRQFKSDDVNERVKRYRNRKETLHETPPETETDTESEQKQRQSIDSDESAPKTLETPKMLFDLWNQYASKSNLVSAKELSDARKSKCKSRLKERPLAEWEKVFSLCASTPFLNGENQNEWRASFDWIISNSDNAVKVLEGKYNNNGKPVPKTERRFLDGIV